MAPLLRLVAWLLLITAATVVWLQAPLLAWAELQFLLPGTDEAAGSLFAILLALTPAQLLARGLVGLLRPPVIGWLQLVILATLILLAIELLLDGVLRVVQARMEQRQPRALLRVRTLPNMKEPAADAALLRSLHALLPARPLAALVGRAPWLALTLQGRRGEPVALGIAVAAPSQSELRHLIDAVRAAVAGHAPGAQIEEIPDLLPTLVGPAAALARRSFRFSGPPELPIRTLADAQVDPLGPLASALQPTGTLYTELHLALRPLRGWALTDGWRREGLRRLVRLQQKRDIALTPDARRLEARLAAPAFTVEMRVVTLTNEPDADEKAEAAIQRVADAIAGFAERTGPWRQGIVLAGSHASPVSSSTGQRALREITARRGHLSGLPRLLLPLPAAAPSLILTVDELCGLWHLPTTTLAGLVQAQLCRHISPPLHAFVPSVHRALPHRDGWVSLGMAQMPDGQISNVGLTIADLRYVLHLTAGMGAGKSRLLANVCQQLLRPGYCLIDGKGDDAGGLAMFVLRLIPLSAESRVVLLDPRDARWPVGLNPLAGLDLSQPGAVDQAVANTFALFARIDPETWGGAQGMRDFLDKALRLVLVSEVHPTLANVKQALLDGDYRARLIERCRNRDVTDYWTVIFPRLGEGQKASRDALMRRFDKLLSADLLRLMITQPQPIFNFGTAIVEQRIVIAPIPNVALGDLAGVYAMLTFQQLLRAAFARPGDDQSRVDYPLLIDELQVLIAEAANDDIETALSRLRSLAVPLVIAHQSLSQLGPVEPLVQINAENRVILKTREPDASAYARQYGHAGLTAADIINQDPSANQYAVLRCAGRPAGPLSMSPLPWPEPVADDLASYDGPPWQSIPTYESPDPELDRQVAQFAYEEVSSDVLNERAEQLSRLPDDMFQLLFERWGTIRAAHLQHIERHPGCLPDKQARIRWRSRLRYALPYVLAEALYRRSRPELPPEQALENRRRGPVSPGGGKGGAPESAAPEPPAFTQADRQPPNMPAPPARPLFPQGDDEA